MQAAELPKFVEAVQKIVDDYTESHQKPRMVVKGELSSVSGSACFEITTEQKPGLKVGHFLHQPQDLQQAAVWAANRLLRKHPR